MAKQERKIRQTLADRKTETENLHNELAYQRLRRYGFKILVRNWQRDQHELDMVAKRGIGEVVFVGVNREPSREAAADYVKRYAIRADGFSFCRVDVSWVCAGTTRISVTETE